MIYDQKKRSGQYSCVILMPAGTKDVQIKSLMWTKKSHCQILPVSSTAGSVRFLTDLEDKKTIFHPRFYNLTKICIIILKEVNFL